jgi:uncharacterized Rmd1/YagE family protein
MELDCVSYFLKDGHDLGQIREHLHHTVFKAELDEVFFRFGEGGYFHVTQYGSLVFLGLSETDRQSVMRDLVKAHVIRSDYRYVEMLSITVDESQEYEVDFDHVVLPFLDDKAAEIIMISMSESAALHYYRDETDQLLEKTRAFTSKLEQTGRIGIGGRRLKTFIGSVLNLKGQISENLYLFDTPSQAWKDEFLNQMDRDLKQELEIHQRYRAIQDKLDIITENLSLFKDLMQHRHSSVLEWIIIVLILIEVIDMIIVKVF